MKLDPTKMKDWQVAEAAEANLKPAAELLKELGHLGGRWRCVGFHEEPARILRELGEMGLRAAMPVWGDRIV